MHPIEFDGVNGRFAVDQDEYRTLPVHHTADENGIVTSCWRFTWLERLKVLFSGRMWLSQLTFNDPLQPQLPQVDYPFDRKPKQDEP